MVLNNTLSIKFSFYFYYIFLQQFCDPIIHGEHPIVSRFMIRIKKVRRSDHF